MILKKITKLLLLTISLFFLSSCVNNNDQEKVNPIIPPIPLTVEALAGTWEVYFFNKLIIPTATNIQSQYRFTENDGFTVTFKPDGTFHENNVFGHETREGKYLLGNYAADDTTKIWQTGPVANQTKDAIFMSFITKKEGIQRLPKSNIPAMFTDHFAFRERYVGDAQGHGYRLEDIRYYRNIAKAPNYMPKDKEFRKSILNVNDILGRWEFYNYHIMIDHVLFPAPSDIRERYGEQMLFRIVDGKQQFFEYTANEHVVANREGEFKIIDDVVNMYLTWKIGPEGAKKDTTISLKLWVKDPLGNNKQMIKSYDRYRDINDVLKEKQEFDFFKKVGDK